MKTKIITYSKHIDAQRQEIHVDKNNLKNGLHISKEVQVGVQGMILNEYYQKHVYNMIKLH